MFAVEFFLHKLLKHIYTELHPIKCTLNVILLLYLFFSFLTIFIYLLPLWPVGNVVWAIGNVVWAVGNVVASIQCAGVQFPVATDSCLV